MLEEDPMAYDRKGAFGYAMHRWNVPCHDGIICTNTKWRNIPAGSRATARFVRDADAGTEHAEYNDVDGSPVTVPWTELDDCAHFVSCCIGKLGGGLQVPSPVPGVYGHFDVAPLVGWLYGLGAATKSYRKMDTSDATDALSHIKLGDVIAYFSTSDGVYKHSALYLGDGKIACHTLCRFQAAWNLSLDYLFTFVHFTG
jgi:hypothetical protein